MRHCVRGFSPEAITSTSCERSVMGVSATWLGLDKGKARWTVAGDVGLEAFHRKGALLRGTPPRHATVTGFSILPTPS
ncbi:hypothetical protein G6F68_018498 [Rhizopus microsporus]|nr:hypothetical protein G6F68_018498 [Rhizopus microsporus]